MSSPMVIGSAALRVTADTQGLDRQVRTAGQGILSQFRGLATAIGGIFAGIQLGNFLQGSITAAADLSESINAINVVLGTGADSFLKFGEDAAQSLGLTQAALNEAVVPIAGLLRNAGLSGDELSGNLQDLATRATDVASVFNVDVDTALGAFGAALRGETEPIRQFGVQLDAASIAAKAVELGLADSTSEVDNAAKTQAAYALILEQTNVAAGDFANTADSYPNLMRRVSASFEEARVAVGEALLPAIIEIGQSLNELIPTLAPLAGALGEAFGQALSGLSTAVGPIIENIASAIRELLPAIAPVAQAFGSIFSAIAPLLPIISQLITTAIVPLANIVSALAESFGPVIELMAQIADEVLSVFQPVISDLTGVFTQLAGVLGEAFLTVLETMAPFLPQIAEAFVSILQSLMPLIEAITPFIPLLAELASTVLLALLPPLTDFLTLLAELLNVILPPLIEVISFFANIISTVLTAAFNSVGFVIGVVRDVLSFLWNNVFVPFGNFLSTIFGPIIDAIKIIWDGLSFAIGVVRDALSFVWNNVFVPVGNFLKTVFTPVVNALGTAFGVVGDAIGFVIDAISTFIGWIGDAIDWIGNLIEDVGEFLGLTSSGQFQGGGAFADFGSNANGGIITRPMISTLGEGYKPEVVIPLTKPNRARQLAEQSGLNRILGANGSQLTFNIYEAGNGRATAQRVVNRLVRGAGR